MDCREHGFAGQEQSLSVASCQLYFGGVPQTHLVVQIYIHKEHSDSTKLATRLWFIRDPMLDAFVGNL